MKKIIILLLLSTNLIAQSNEKAAVSQAVENLRLALLNTDANNLSNILHKNLSYGHSAGVTETYEQVNRLFVSGDYDFTELNFSDIDISVTKNTATVRHKLSGKLSDHQKPAVDININIVMVFIKEKNTWKLLLRQGFRKP